MLNISLFARPFCLLALCFGMAGCAGFRAGVESVAYLDSADHLQPRQSHGMQARHNLSWQDVRFSVELNNKLQTRDHTVMLFVVPTTIDPFDKFIGANDSNKLVAFVEMKSVNPEVSFDATAVRFIVNGQTHPPIKVSEYARWNEDGQVNNLDGKWGYRDLRSTRVLQDSEHNYSFKLEFDLDRPSPREESYQLDLSRALKFPNGEQGPLVKFKALPWKHGYT
mgnify:FL=1